MKIVLQFGRASEGREPRRFSINMENAADKIVAYVQQGEIDEPLTPGEEFRFGDFTISFHSADPADLPGANQPRSRAEYIDSDYRVIDEDHGMPDWRPENNIDLTDYIR